jgi:acrylyl-CoA reductase (NADPH)
MASETFRAWVVSEQADKTFTRAVQQRTFDSLPPNDVLLRVDYASLNYKDALSFSGNKGVTRAYPHTPGIDAAGEVADVRTDAFLPGDEVLLTGFDFGMNTSGGLAEYASVRPEWLLRRPDGLSARDAMVYGTAGFTAALCIHRLRNHGLTPTDGEVLVTGASGGVGSLAVAILSKLGYSVAAVTGKPEAREWLESLGAKTLLTREEATDTTRPMLKERWAGAIDTVGGDILATAIKSTRRDGAVACCGLVQSAQLTTSVFPFILRGVTLIGVDSVETQMTLREQIWKFLAGPWRPDEDVLNALTTEVALEDLGPHIDAILKGGVRGRVIVRL